MNKKIFLILFVFLFFASYVYAQQIIIFNFNYNHGKITLKDQIIKEGFYPDRNIEQGKYICDLKDSSNQKKYSLNFDLPIKLYTDALEKEEAKGGVIILNETDFSFITPYYENYEKISCFNERGYEILTNPIKKQTLSPENSNWRIWVISILSFLFLVIIVFIFERYRKNKEKIKSF